MVSAPVSSQCNEWLPTSLPLFEDQRVLCGGPLQQLLRQPAPTGLQEPGGQGERAHNQGWSNATIELSETRLGSPGHSAGHFNLPCSRVWRGAIHFFLLPIRFLREQISKLPFQDSRCFIYPEGNYRYCATVAIQRWRSKIKYYRIKIPLARYWLL